MTDDEEFIAGFLEVFEKNPQIFIEQPDAVDALKNLSNTLSDMTDKSNEEVADAIGEWCEEYPDLTYEINSIISRKLEPKPIKQERRARTYAIKSLSKFARKPQKSAC